MPQWWMQFFTGRVALGTNGNPVGKGDIAAHIDKVFKDNRSDPEAEDLSFEDAMKLHYSVYNQAESYKSTAYPVDSEEPHG